MLTSHTQPIFIYLFTHFAQIRLTVIHLYYNSHAHKDILPISGHFLSCFLMSYIFKS